MTISKAKRTSSLKFASALAEISAKAPDDEIKSRIYSTVHAIRKKYGYEWWEKKVEVERCIKFGAATISDLQRETPFNKQELQSILKELESEGTVRSEPYRVHGTGPKVLHFFPLDTVNT